ncbi:hypothetical protein KM043_007684 [Ampulex compressa]|nr:hypothetical protein KM043_007684 [Ampulex compressa]
MGLPLSNVASAQFFKVPTWVGPRLRPLGEAKRRHFCDQLPRDVWRRCKDDLRCLKCSKRYSDWRSLRKHMNFFCQMEPLYPCPYCAHRARIPTLLKYHIVREHSAFVVTDESR